MTRSVRVQVSSEPQSLTDLEGLCRVARERAFTDDAWVLINDNRHVTINQDAEVES